MVLNQTRQEGHYLNMAVIMAVIMAVTASLETKLKSKTTKYV